MGGAYVLKSMENAVPHLSNKTLNQSGLPIRVLTLCDGLLQINADFFDNQLQKLLNEFESFLFQTSENARSNEQQISYISNLRNLKRTRHDFIPQFLAAVEHQLACLRASSELGQQSLGSESMNAADMQLIEAHLLDESQIQHEISSRCESQHSFDIFLLGQRFGVLAGSSALEPNKMPIGPSTLCACLQEAMQCLDLESMNMKQVYYLFERYVFTNYSELLHDCNQFLIEHGVLPNLSYVPFRNPELRHKKTPMAAGEKQLYPVRQEPLPQAPADPIDTVVIPFKSASDQHENLDTSRIEESFSRLRQLLAKRKQLLNKLNSFSNTYLSESGPAGGADANTLVASHDQLNTILHEFQNNAVSNPNARASVQHLKHDLLAHLRNQSTDDQELILNPEDSDAIDLVGLLMDSALKDVNPNSVASQLLTLMQTPLIRVVLEDKSFFSNHVHPARQMLNVIAETGFHWLDETDRNDALHGEISNIVTNTVKDFDGDNQKLFVAYEQTNHLLQTLIKKAEAAERRQIDAARGKERLSVARQHASESISEVMKSHNLSPFISSLLGQAWTDVMALTELRDGRDSAAWFELKVIAERIIASHECEIGKPDEAEAKVLIEKIGSALTLVGYHDEEASNIAESLFAIESTDLPRPAMSVLEKIRFGEHTQSANSSAFELDENQEAWVDQIKELPRYADVENGRAHV